MKYFTVLSLGTFTLLLNSCDSNRDSSADPYLVGKQYHVGDIVHDSKLDPAPQGFQPCNDFYSFQYYNFESNGPKYKGERPQLMKDLLAAYELPITEPESAFITVRFLVNCKGETGWYRTSVINHDYQPKTVSIELRQAVENAVKELKGWQIKYYQGEAKDYHQYVTLRIENNQIISITP